MLLWLRKHVWFVFPCVWLPWRLIQTTSHTKNNDIKANFTPSNMLSTVDHGSKTEGGNWSASSFCFSFFFPPRRTLPCTCSSSSSSVHLAYIYRVHKCNNNPLNAPCGRRAGKQMLDFTSKIEPTRGDLNKNSLLAHISDDEKRNNGTHKGHTCGCCEPTTLCNYAS